MRIARCRRFLRTLVCRLIVLGQLLWLCALPAHAAEPPVTVTVDDSFAPLFFRDAAGEWQGLTRDLWALWSSRTGIPVRFEVLPFAGGKQAILDGRADVIDLIAVNEERRAIFDFSEPYLNLDVALYFHKSISGIVDAASSRGFLIGVIAGHASTQRLLDAGSVNLKYYDNYEALFQGVANGEVRVFCSHQQQAGYYLNLHGLADDFRHSPPIFSLSGHWAVRKGDTTTYDKVAEGFRRITPEERQALFDKWLGVPASPLNLPLYLRYAGWLLLALAGLALLLLVWNRMLSTRVAQKTQHLTRTLEELCEAQQVTAATQAHLEELVAQRTRELTAIFNSAPVGIMLLRERKIEQCNHRLEELLGYDNQTLIGTATQQLYTDDETWMSVGDELYSQLTSGITYSRELQARRRDGSRLWVRLSARAIDPANPEAGIVAMVDDISEARAARVEMERARELAEDAARTKAAFLANMSHEIRTPMNAIIGFTHLLRKHALDAEAADKVERIHAAGKHLLGIINEILDFSKIEAGKLLIVPEAMSLQGIADNVLAMLTESATAKGLQLRVEGPVPGGLLHGDPTRITQALVNLVGNAIKFTDSGSITLRIGREHETETQLKVRFEVTDTGIGVAPDQVPTLFAPFHQPERSLTKRFGGTGLGLAITRRLAELMGGEAGVHSTPGIGSTFWFSVLLDKQGEDGRVPAEAASAPAGETLATHFAGTHLLVVEDDEINQILAREYLEEAGLVIDLANDGQEAVERMCAAPPGQYALILMDMQMPRLDGLEATRRIRTLPQGRDIPIIAMTANAFAEDRAQCEAAGMNDFVAKPVDPEVLYQTLGHWLNLVHTPARH